MSFPLPAQQRLQPYLRQVELGAGKAVFHADEPFPFVYFPETAVISVLSSLDSGNTLQVAVIGRTGMTGASLFSATGTMPCDGTVQIPGSALRLKSSVLADELRQSEALRNVLDRYMHVLMAQAIRAAACNNFHSLKSRCARWLLMLHDLVDADTFPLTQDILATMLGVLRPSVTMVARTLQRQGMIAYRHGHMKVLDRRRLESASCSCYTLMRQDEQRLFETALTGPSES